MGLIEAAGKILNFATQTTDYSQAPPMLDIPMNIYSRVLLGGVVDPNTFSKKIGLLSRLVLIDSVTRNVKVSDSDSLLALFRVVHFTGADLLVCKDATKNEVLWYRNPCNLRNSIIAAIRCCETSGLSGMVTELESIMDLHFRGGYHPPLQIVASPSPHPFESMYHVTSSVKVIDGQFGRSLVATEDFNRGETVLTLSADVPICIMSAFRHTQFPGADLFNQGLHPDTIFLLYLVFLRDRADSLDIDIHRDFFASQPTNYGTLFELPLAVANALDEPDLVEAVTSQNQHLESICQSLQPAPEFCSLLWAKSLCTSRGFSLPMVPISDVERAVIREYYPSGLVTTLLPIVHFFNHDFAAQCETPTVSETGRIEVKSLVKIAADSEVFINYGGFSNKELILNYGFFIPRNPYDAIETADKYVRRGAIAEEADEEVDDELPSDLPEEYRQLVLGYRRDKRRFLNAAMYV